MVLIASLAFSISMIQTSFEEWRDFPIVTTVERTDGIAAVDNIFPSVTICRGSTSQPDNWVLSELILDFFEFHCLDQSKCNKTEKTQNDFKQLTELIYKVSTKIVNDSYEKHPELRDWGISTYLGYKEKINELSELIKNDDNFTLDSLDAFLKVNMFKMPDIALQNLVDNMKEDLKLQKSKIGLENDTDSNNTLTKFLIKTDLLANTMHFKLGFTYHTWANLLLKPYNHSNKDLFSNCFNKGKMMNKHQYNELCRRNSDAVDNFHEALRKVSQKLDLNISLYDLPTFLNHIEYKINSVDFVQHFPCYTMCQKIGYHRLRVDDANIIAYFSHWRNFTVKSGYKNPYLYKAFPFIVRHYTE